MPSMPSNDFQIPPFDINRPFNDNEARAIVKLRALIGDDVQRGLYELRRLLAIEKSACAAETLLLDAHDLRHQNTPGDERVGIWEAWPEAMKASSAADAACQARHDAVRYVWKMPIRTVIDAIAKAQFAIEMAELADDDEDFKGDTLRQIAAFLSPQGFVQAAE